MKLRLLQPKIYIEEPLLELLFKLHQLNNDKVIGFDRKPLCLGGTITIMLRHALMQGASGILNEHEKLGLQSVASDFDGDETISAAEWFPPPTEPASAAEAPKLPNSKRGRPRVRPPFFPWFKRKT